MNRRRLIVFDVNETLLDLETLTPTFERVLGDAVAMRLWFAKLQMLAASHGAAVSEDDEHALTEAFATMPPHKEVPSALLRLRDAGFRLFTLTDNLLEIQTRQLEHGGILGHFERRFSADSIGTHKPAREAYRLVLTGDDLDQIADQLIERYERS
jgi:2-haloacid dehalogenase